MNALAAVFRLDEVRVVEKLSSTWIAADVSAAPSKDFVITTGDLVQGIALFSIANSMALSIHERTRELGLLRSVGMTRAQLRSAVRWESVLIALLGTGFGVVLGIFFGWAISVSVRVGGLGAFSLPVPSIVIIAVLAVIGALLAPARPTWRAARLDILRAIASE